MSERRLESGIVTFDSRETEADAVAAALELQPVPEASDSRQQWWVGRDAFIVRASGSVRVVGPAGRVEPMR